jgi:hypothetical protein
MNRQYTQPNATATASSGEKFLSDENRRMLYGVLSKDFVKRGVTLTPQLSQQLDQFLNHYVNEVHSVQGAKPLTFLNKEVLVVTAQEFTNSILKKPAAAASVPATATATARAGQAAQQQTQVITAVRATGKPTTTGLQGLSEEAAAGSTAIDSLFMDTGSRFDALQKERMEVKKQAPPMPDFKLDFSDEGPSPMELFERAKKAREEAMQALADEQAAKQSTDVFVPSETRPPRVTNFENEFYTDSRDKGVATSSPNLLSPPETDRKILSQQVVIKDDDVVSYKEIETNLIIYSADRDWVANEKSNRYDFSVNFDPANNRQGFAPSPAANIKFKNIVRIEFVKAILPAEGLDVLVQQITDEPTFSTNINTSALSFPFITLHVDEYRGNNYGTDNHLDNSFAVLQYDAMWAMDITNNNANRGFIAFIPKNLKAQRIFTPTPLSTLSRLSLRIQRPDGTLLQTALDTSVVADVLASTEADTSLSNFHTGAGDARYLFVKTTKHFSKFAVQVGDRIQFKNFVATNVTYPDAATQLDTFMNRESGHLVAGIAYDDDLGVIQADGANNVGYANYIIIESRMEDPTTGSTAVNLFDVDNNDTFLEDSTYVGHLINLNRQTQFVFRIITRELDPESRLRPDNLN